MIIKNVQTLVFEYPDDYQAEIEWNKKRDGDWVHQSTDTMCSVYTLTNNYLIPTKAKHSFLDNPYFEAEPSDSEKPNNCEDWQDWQDWKDKMWAAAVVTEPQYDFGEYADRLWKIAYERGKREALEQTEPSCDTCKLKDTTEWCKRQEVCRAYEPKDEPQTCSVNGRPYSECSSCEHFRCTADDPQTEYERGYRQGKEDEINKHHVGR